MPDERIRPDEPPRRARDDDASRRRDEDDFDEDERPRRRRPPEEQGDITGGLIPYKNGSALASYYCGVFSLIPCLGLFLGPIAVILGVLGLRYANAHPSAGGKAHGIVGCVLGTLVIIGHVAAIILVAAGGLK